MSYKALERDLKSIKKNLNDFEAIQEKLQILAREQGFNLKFNRIYKKGWILFGMKNVTEGKWVECINEIGMFHVEDVFTNPSIWVNKMNDMLEETIQRVSNI